MCQFKNHDFEHKLPVYKEEEREEREIEEEEKGRGIRRTGSKRWRRRRRHEMKRRRIYFVSCYKLWHERTIKVQGRDGKSQWP